MNDELQRALADFSQEQLDRVNPAELQEKVDAQRALPPTHSRAGREEFAAERIDSRLRKLDCERQKGRVRKARAELLSSTARIDAHDKTVSGISESIENAKRNKDSLIDGHRAEAAEELLLGKRLRNAAAKRKSIANETERIEAGEAALEMAAPKRAKLEAAVRQANANLCDETHDLVGAGALADLQRARRALAALAPHLARLWAWDVVRDRLLGDKWSFDTARARPLSGATIVSAFVRGIPERLGVEELGEASLRTAAERIASQIVADIEENHS